MQKISEVKIVEYKYDSEKERELHVKEMESLGFECSGQVKRSDDAIMSSNREYYWYGKFFKTI